MPKIEQKGEHLRTNTDIRFVCPPDASTELILDTKLLNESMQSFHELFAWATRNQKSISQDAAKVITDLTTKNDGVGNLIDVIHSTMWSILEVSTYSTGNITGVKNMLFPPTEAPIAPLTPSITEQEVLLDTQEAAKKAAKTIAAGCHNLQNLTQLFFVAVRLFPSDPKNVIKDLRGDFSRTKQLIRAIQNELLETYPHSKLNCYDMLFRAENLSRHYLTDYEISIERSTWDKKPSAVQWSSAWYDAFLMNVIQNTQRANAKLFHAFIRISKEATGTWVNFYFDNDGVDADPYIVNHGFQTGVTRFHGEGVGMAHQAKVLREHYGGNLTLEYRTDEQGNRVPGARVHLRLPAHNVPRE